MAYRIAGASAVSDDFCPPQPGVSMRRRPKAWRTSAPLTGISHAINLSKNTMFIAIPVKGAASVAATYRRSGTSTQPHNATLHTNASLGAAAELKG